jgi:hypothetical protein|tara:strand:- start:614 stop:877 length:264 start_codon:yes stop_codon:yes gene_type:complete
MALKKQSLRSGVHVMMNGKLATKEELIKLSESWSEKREIFFRKMLSQGGAFLMEGNEFNIILRQNIKERSDGEIDAGVKQIPGDSAF